MNRKLIVFLPLMGILAVCALLLLGLQQDPKKIASALIGKPIPEFSQANLMVPQQMLNNRDLPNTFFLLNVWGSWCVYCKQEHPFLMKLAEKGISIVGLNYRDKAQSAVDMLKKMGNPYYLVINDSQGTLAMKLGVDGAPETYLIDPQGIIRYRYSGELNEKTWQQEFEPEIQKWQLKP